MGFSSWIRGKVGVTVLVAVFCYFTASSLGIVPQPVKDFVSWGDRNTNALLFTVCFLVACLVIWKWKRRKEEES